MLFSLRKSCILMNISTTKINNTKINASIRRSASLWTQNGVVKSPYAAIESPNSNTTFYDYVWENLDKWPQKTLSVCAETGRGYTYEQVFKLSNVLAVNLQKNFFIKYGDNVSIILPNLPEYPIVVMGIIRAGAIVSTINPMFNAHEIWHMLALSQSKVIITLPELIPTVKTALQNAKSDIPIVAIRNGGQSVPEGIALFEEFIDYANTDLTRLNHVKANIDDTCFQPFSSGTTGLPKGVEMTHKNLTSFCLQFGHTEIRSHNDTTNKHQDSVLAVLPFFHVYGAIVTMIYHMSVGIKIVTLSNFQPELFLQMLEKHKPQTLHLAPMLVKFLATNGTPKILSSVECVISGAAPLTSNDVNKFFEKVQHPLSFRQGYGMTEILAATLADRHTDDYNRVGFAFPNTELRIVDNELNNLGPNEEGELLVKGPQVMKGYKNNPKETKESFVDGWLRTGDLAAINKEGPLVIVDRLKELIKVKGFQVAPAELEGILRGHPAVADVGVTGVPHPTNGEAPRAFVVLKQSVQAKAEDIKEFINTKVASYKKIQDIVFLDAIPKNSTGKIIRRVLKEKHC